MEGGKKQRVAVCQTLKSASLLRLLLIMIDLLHRKAKQVQAMNMNPTAHSPQPQHPTPDHKTHATQHNTTTHTPHTQQPTIIRKQLGIPDS